ncbi:unnamed protein product [Coffea canephora]|uniref:DH200=94 genomic scaffold, scaffold_386 n=1 Tax=Coffea canephora TaxID=49390 RepID=A0A068VF84_COFCA|nr:unnamed protein product [Coffea canephora]
MGGLGKTTLVKKVYDDAAFRDIIKNLIQQLYNEIRRPVPRQVESMDDIMLSEFVRDFLRERRYILVLDDMWSIDAWEAIKCVLPDCNITSRVVLTTRIADVASASCLGSLDSVYKMEPLSNQDSWTLFCNRTFHSNDCPPNLEEVAKKILKKCEGLPLAIVAIGGVLALKDKEKTDEWEMILHGFGGEADGSGKLDRIKRVLLLSYNDLPHYLKSCLLYLSIYPEDYSILVDHILPKWIALGFVEEKGGIISTDIAMSYMKELINRSLIQVKSTWDDGTLDTCGLHDFVREILVSKSKDQSVAVTSRPICRRVKYLGIVSSRYRIGRDRDGDDSAETSNHDCYCLWHTHFSLREKKIANFEIKASFGIEATELYPDVKYTTLDEYLSQFVSN